MGVAAPTMLTVLHPKSDPFTILYFASQNQTCKIQDSKLWSDLGQMTVIQLTPPPPLNGKGGRVAVRPYY